MTHLKIWLLVGLTVIMAILVVWLPQEHKQQASQLRQRWIPLETSRNFRQYLHQQQQKLLTRAQHIAHHNKVAQSLQPLVDTANSDRWNWRERQAHKQVINALEQHTTSFRKVALHRKLYIFSNQHRILVENGEIISSSPQDHALSRLAILDAAKGGQSLTGLWSQQDQSYLVASTPVWAKVENTQEPHTTKKANRVVTGVVLLMQPLSAQMLADWKPQPTDRSGHLVMFFNHRHPLFYHHRSDSLPKHQASSPSKQRSESPTAPRTSTSISPIEQAFKHWSARNFTHLLRDVQQGVLVSKTPISLHQQAYYATVGQVSSSISNAQVGYVILHPVVSDMPPLYQSNAFLIAVIISCFAFSLGLWTSFSLSTQQKQLHSVLSEILINPNSLQSVKQLPTSFSSLFQYLRPLAHRLQQNTVHEKTAAPISSGSYGPIAQSNSLSPSGSSAGSEGFLQPKSSQKLGIQPGQPNSSPQNTLEMIRALSADGSLVLPQRPKGMTYFSTKEDVAKNSSPLDMLRQDIAEIASDNTSSAHEKFPSFISSTEAESLIPSTPSHLKSVDTSTSNTPLPRAIRIPTEDSSSSEPMFAEVAAMTSALRQSPEPVSFRQPSESVGTSTKAGTEVKEIAASQLPLVSKAPSPAMPSSVPSPAVPSSTSVRLAPASPGHLNLTTELDYVFSSIASSMTPAPPSQMPGAASQVPTLGSPLAAPAVQLTPSPSLVPEKYNEEKSLPFSVTPYAEEDKMRNIFQDYLNMRKSCGEPINTIQWDSFVELLRNQKAAILQQYSCKDVNFYVQEKDGRAALKATPVH